MKTRLLIILAIGMSGLLAPSAFGITEELIQGSSSLELLPTEITTGKPASFEIKFQYTEGPYALDNFIPVFEINPASVKPHVKIDVKSTEVAQGQIIRIPVTLTIDPKIEHEKVYLSISFTGDHFSSRSDATYKSAWIESAIIDIVQGNVLSLGPLVPEPEPSCKEGTILTNGACVSADGPMCGPGTIYQDGICVVDETENSTKISTDPSNRWGGSNTFDVESPLKQIKSGIVIDEIQCRESLVLVTKHDDSPACVKPETKQKLIERGWADEYTVVKCTPSIFDSGKECTSETIVIIGKNNTVVFRNTYDRTLNLVSDYQPFWNTEMLNRGETYTHTFEKPGFYPFHEEPEPWRTGTIIVLSDDYNVDDLPSSRDYDFERMHMNNTCTKK